MQLRSAIAPLFRVLVVCIPVVVPRAARAGDPILPGQLFDASYGASLLATGDMNHDGHPDVVAVDWNGGVAVLLGDGAGGFAAPIVVTAPAAPFAHALGDLDQNGDLDVVLAGADDHVWVMTGNGAGGLVAGGGFPTGAAPWSIATGDVNGDGKPDVVSTAHDSSAVSLLIGDGAGSLGAFVNFPCAAQPYHVSAGDADGDAFDDVVVASNTTPNGALSLLHGSASGVLSAPQTFIAGVSTHCARLADVNTDGAADVIGANVLSDDLTVLLHSGANAYVPAPPVAAGDYPSYCVALDADQDGLLDLAASNEFASTATMLRGHGDGSFAAPDPYVVAGAPATIATADFDGDGDPDVVTSHANGDLKVTLLLGASGAKLMGARTYATHWATPFAVAIGDLDEDGRPDLVSADYCSFNCGGLTVLLADGAGGFAMSGSYTSNFSPQWVSVVDVNQDRHLDVLCANRNPGSVSVFLGNGHGALSLASTVSTGMGVVHLAVGDLNGDATPDLVECNYNSASVGIYFGNGGGGFALHQTLNTGAGSGPIKCAIGDVNHDGLPDVLVAQVGLASVLLYRGIGGGTLGAATSLPVGATQQALALGDWNRDGNLDFATNGQSGVRVKFGNGAGAFPTFADVATGYGPRDLAAADVDGDGRLDLVGAGSAVMLNLGDGAGGFSATLTYADPGTPYALAIGDLDADGRTDVVTANYNASSVEVLRGQRALPAGVVSYGLGTPGCNGVLGMAASPTPQPGQAAFTFTCTNAPRSSVGFLLLGAAPLDPGMNVGGVGILLALDPFAAPLVIVPLASDPSGSGSLKTGIPANIPVGFAISAQTAWLQPAGASCGASPLGYVSSRGVTITIQP